MYGSLIFILNLRFSQYSTFELLQMQRLETEDKIIFPRPCFGLSYVLLDLVSLYKVRNRAVVHFEEQNSGA